MSFFGKIFVSMFAIMVAAHVLPGVHIRNNSLLTALIVSVVLAFLDAVVKPLMLILTIPVTVFSFGLFLLVINAAIILIAAYLVDGFEVHGFWAALFFSLILSLLTSFIEGAANGRQDNKKSD